MVNRRSLFGFLVGAPVALVLGKVASRKPVEDLVRPKPAFSRDTYDFVMSADRISVGQLTVVDADLGTITAGAKVDLSGQPSGTITIWPSPSEYGPRIADYIAKIDAA